MFPKAFADLFSVLTWFWSFVRHHWVVGSSLVILDRLLVVSMLEMAVFTVFPVLRVDLVEFCLGFMRLWNIF